MPSILKLTHFCVLVFFLVSAQLATADEITPKPQHHKVFMLGLDGATWRILLPLLDEGLLPNLKKAMDDGVYGNLLSQDAFSPPSWSSIFTGVGKDKHGIYDYVIRDNFGCKFMRQTGANEPELYSGAIDFQVKPVWDLASAAGARVGVVGCLPTYPVSRLNGVAISGDLTPNLLFPEIAEASLEQCVSEDTGSLRHYRGDIFGSKARLDEREPGRFHLSFEDDPGGIQADLEPDKRMWFHLRLDGDPQLFYSTSTDILPMVRMAEWKNLGPTDSGPLQISLFSDVSPRAYYEKRNRPLLLLLDSTTSSGRYDRVRFAMRPDVKNCSDEVELFGFEVTAQIKSDGFSIHDSGELVLHPETPDPVNLHIEWESSETEAPRPVLLKLEGQKEPQADPWLTFMDWIARNRRSRQASGSAFEGLTRGILTIQPMKARLEFGGIFDSFANPTYNFIYPRDFMKTYDVNRIPANLSIELWRNDYIKQLLCVNAFDTDKFDLFLFTFVSPDSAQHLPWNSTDPMDHEVSFKNWIAIEHWKEIDRFIGALLGALGPEWVILMASDHGFDRVDNRRGISIDWNGIFQDLGLLTAIQPTPESRKKFYQPPRDSAYRVEIAMMCNQEITDNSAGALVLLDAHGSVVNDSVWYPGNGAYPPSRWRPGTVITSRTELVFEETVPPGDYRLLISAKHPYEPNAPSRELGAISIPDTPLSLIKAEGLMRIGDVDVQAASEYPARPTEGAFVFRPGVTMVSSSITTVANRAWDYVESMGNKIDRENSICAYLAANDIDGKILEKDGIYLIGKPEDSQLLLEDLSAMVRSFSLVGSIVQPFHDVAIDSDRNCVTWETILEAFGPETSVGPLAFRTYDPGAIATYRFRTKNYRRPLRELVTSDSIGSHAPEGLYVLSGNSIPDLGPGADAVEWDIAPTVLKLMGLPGAESMDGKHIEPRIKTRAEMGVKKTGPVVDQLYEELQAIGYLKGLTQ